MKKRVMLAATVIQLLLSADALAVYKCAAKSGVIYQDAPCADGEKLGIENRATQPRISQRQSLQRSASFKPSTLPKIGSSWGDAITHMGRQPDRENSRQSSLGASHQLVFNYDDGVVYLYIRNGVLESASEYDR